MKDDAPATSALQVSIPSCAFSLTPSPCPRVPAFLGLRQRFSTPPVVPEWKRRRIDGVADWHVLARPSYLG